MLTAMVTGPLHVEGWDVPLQEPEVLGVSLLVGHCRLSWKCCLGSVLGCRYPAACLAGTGVLGDAELSLMVAVCASGIEML